MTNRAELVRARRSDASARPEDPTKASSEARGVKVHPEVVKVLSDPQERKIVGSQVKDFLDRSRAFQEGRVAPLIGDARAMRTIADRLHEAAQVEGRLSPIGTRMAKESEGLLGQWERRPDEIREALIEMALPAISSVVAGATVLTEVSRAFNTERFKGISQRILKALAYQQRDGLPGVLLRESRDQKALRGMIVGNAGSRNRAVQALAPFVSGLQLVEMSEDLDMAGNKYQRESRSLMQRAGQLAHKINSQAAMGHQREINDLLIQIDEYKNAALEQASSLPGEILSIGVEWSDPAIIGSRLDQIKQLGAKAQELRKLMAQRDMHADKLREQLKLGCQTLANFLNSMLMDDLSNFSKNLAVITRFTGFISLAQTAYTQALMAGISLKIASEYIIYGGRMDTSGMENDIRRRLGAGRNLLNKSIGSHPELPQLEL